MVSLLNVDDHRQYPGQHTGIPIHIIDTKMPVLAQVLIQYILAVNGTKKFPPHHIVL